MTVPRSFSLTIVSASLGATLAGCSPSPNYACPALAFPGPQLVYPVPGATGVSSAAGYLVFATAQSPANFKASLVPATGASVPVAALGAPPVPLPSPIASPLALATVYGASHPALAARTTYDVDFASEPGSAYCSFPVESSGSFTTR
jgi:hypothetical protein